MHLQVAIQEKLLFGFVAHGYCILGLFKLFNGNITTSFWYSRYCSITWKANLFNIDYVVIDIYSKLIVC